ncbi:MAG TPA: hypothetical protein VHO02_00240 [Fibrobacteria bacterium]|nr:hypothetical protein [Fibrobacteria bacterium]
MTKSTGKYGEAPDTQGDKDGKGNQDTQGGPASEGARGSRDSEGNEQGRQAGVPGTRESAQSQAWRDGESEDESGENWGLNADRNSDQEGRNTTGGYAGDSDAELDVRRTRSTGDRTERDDEGNP